MSADPDAPDASADASPSAIPNGGASWEALEELGHGAMGVVWRARQLGLDRPAVLKKMRRELLETPQAEARFLREARLAARIDHPNVVTVFDCFRRRGVLTLALELVDGPDLGSALLGAGPAPPRIAGLIALELLRGLEAIHERAAVHRDLKPANILLGRRGEVKIGDFGIAFGAGEPDLTRTGVAVGTPVYMAPEQLEGGRGDPRADVYAFGVVLHELLAGTPPWAHPGTSGELDEGLLHRKRRGPRPPTPGPRFLRRVVRRCLRVRPERRPDVIALRRAFERHLRPPAAPELRAEVAAWLRAAGLAEPRADETVILLRPPSAGLASAPWLRFALAAGAFVSLVATAAAFWLASRLPAALHLLAAAS